MRGYRSAILTDINTDKEDSDKRQTARSFWVVGLAAELNLKLQFITTRTSYNLRAVMRIVNRYLCRYLARALDMRR